MPISKDLNNNGIIQVNDDITSMDNIMLSFWTQMAQSHFPVSLSGTVHKHLLGG